MAGGSPSPRRLASVAGLHSPVGVSGILTAKYIAEKALKERIVYFHVTYSIVGTRCLPSIKEIRRNANSLLSRPIVVEKEIRNTKFSVERTVKKKKDESASVAPDISKC